MENKKRLLLIAIVFFAALLVVPVLLNRTSDEKLLTAQEIKRLPDPELVAEKFLYALMEDNISLAKELVIPEKRKRIDQWKIDTQHQAFECSYNWRWFLNDPIQLISSGGAGGVVIDKETIRARSSFGCTNNNQSMRIEDVIVKSQDGEWTIIDWGEICETPASYDKRETCYP